MTRTTFYTVWATVFLAAALVNMAIGGLTEVTTLFAGMSLALGVALVLELAR